MEKECMNCGGSIYFQCRKEAAKYNDRLSSREGASEMLNVLVRTEYSAAYPEFKFPDGTMLDMRIMAYYSIPKSTSKKKKASMLANEIRPTKKPDMDNVVKIIADSLNQVAYRDDTQIVDCQCRKFYSETPRVEVIIRSIEPK